MHKTHGRSRKWHIIIGCIALLLIGLLIGARLYLSVWLLDYVNNVLSHINGYQGSVESINIDLYRSAYRINKLVINKVDGKIPTPFVAIDKTDFSLQWGSLLHGRIVSDATLTHPVINFAVNKSASQTGENVDWTKPIKDLMPIDINHVHFDDGSITYQDFSSTPQVNIYIRHMEGEVKNLRNVKDKDHPLPSTLEVKGSSIGNGDLKIKGRMNILKEVPDMNLLLALENVNLPALNNYSEAYGAFNFNSGKFNLYSKIIEKDGHISGYVKPMVTDLSVDVFKTANPLEVVWSTIVAATLKVFTNLPRDQFATKVELEGNAGNIDANTWSALGGIFRNAFISAMTKGFDQTDNKEIAKPTE